VRSDIGRCIVYRRRYRKGGYRKRRRVASKKKRTYKKKGGYKKKLVEVSYLARSTEAIASRPILAGVSCLFVVGVVAAFVSIKRDRNAPAAVNTEGGYQPLM